MCTHQLDTCGHCVSGQSHGKTSTMRIAASPVAIRVLVVDDSLPFREAARVLIEATTGFEWIGDACSGEAAVEQAASLKPHLVLMDVRMPGIGGVEAARKIAAAGPPPIVVLISGADLPAEVPDGTAAEMLAKDRLTPASLRRLWQAHAPALG